MKMGKTGETPAEPAKVEETKVAEAPVKALMPNAKLQMPNQVQSSNVKKEESESRISGSQIKSGMTNQPITIQQKAAKENQMTQEEIERIYLGESKENEAVNQAMERIARIAGNGPKPMLDYSYKVLTPANKTEAVASLKAMAQIQIMDQWLKDPRTAEFLKERVPSELFIKYRENPLDPVFFQNALKCALEDKLLLDSYEAARMGLQIGNLLKQSGNPAYQDYNKIARFNLEKGKFEWSE